MIQFESNLRIGFRHKKDIDLFCGAPKDYSDDYEKHFITFEKYSKMPLEMRVLKEKMMKDAVESPKKADELKH